MGAKSRAEKWRLIRGTNLKTEDRHVLLTLFLFQGDNGAAFCKQETLADEIGVSTRSIRKSLKRLNAAGIVVSEWKILNSIPMRHYAIQFDALKKVQRANGRNHSSYPETCNGRNHSSYPETCNGRNHSSGPVGTIVPDHQEPQFLHEHPRNIQGTSSEGGTRKNKFQKPTSEQVKAYAAELDQPTFDAGKFCDHYESNGWRVGGKGLMKCWRASVRQWIRSGGTQSNGKPAGNAEALKAWGLILRAAQDNHGNVAGFESAIGHQLAGILKNLRLTRQKIDQANNFERREQEREFLQAFSRQGAAA
jgi:hypothetical protein